MSKSENTKAFIIETVAPIFNQNGYAAMSLSKITAATGLTKGAIYGHFTNKEVLAMEAFRFSVRRVFEAINEEVSQGKTPLDKLLKIASFYKKYYQYSKQYGGCPILNIGVDSSNKESLIADLVKSYNLKILEKFVQLIDEAKASNQVKQHIDSLLYAKRFFYMIEGAIYMSFIMDDETYILDAATFMEQLIDKELKQ